MAFQCGAALHSAVDIVTHANDGPLLLWPVESSIRFHSPFSHWDFQSGATWVIAAEICIWAAWLVVVRRALVKLPQKSTPALSVC